MDGRQKLVKFQINHVSYGVDLNLVKEILVAWTIIPVSTLQEDVSGVIFLRGEDIPVINMRHLFGMAEPEIHHTGQRIIIIGMMNAVWKSFGFLVDSVCHVIEVKVKDLEALNISDTETCPPFVKGKVTGRILIDGDEKNGDEGVPSSVVWLDSDRIIESTMKGSRHLEPQIPYL